MTPKKAVQMHESARHKGEPKTFYKGGKTDAGMRKHGRGLEKVANQKTGMKKP